MPAFDGARGCMHYLDEGHGEPALVLLHAFPLTSAMWETQIAALSPHRRIVAPDLLGFGHSEVPSERADYSVDRWADDLAALMAGLGLERVVLAGLSMGGYVALAFARRHRNRLAGLVLADTRPGADTPEVRARREQQQELLADEPDPRVLAERLLRPLAGESSSRRVETLAAAQEMLAANRPAGVIGGLEALKQRPDATGELAGIMVPTLVVVGDQDQPSPRAVAEEMAAAIAGSRLVVIPDAGHLTNMENPSAFNQALEAFLRRL